uniref:F-box domain-containing protein n=3 Tax=Meloidogyne TaxID=189290 RepID=A0A914MJ32_MELIC
MLSLPTETKLDIFKFLTHQQLCSIKQTNFYFYDFITNFEGDLAREKLYNISIGNFNTFKELPHKLIKPDAKDFDFLLNEQIEEKLKNGLETPIPLYLHGQNSSENIFICLDKGPSFCPLNCGQKGLGIVFTTISN